MPHDDRLDRAYAAWRTAYVDGLTEKECVGRALAAVGDTLPAPARSMDACLSTSGADAGPEWPGCTL